MTRSAAFSVIILPILLLACHDPDVPEPDPQTGKLEISFDHRFDHEIVQFDTLKYANAAGNQLLFTELQYFISDVTLHYQDGSAYSIDAWKDIHYVDSDLPETSVWDVFDEIPAGQCDSVSFTFGINEAKNQSFLYVNPPESLMFWPDILGGGYHYMKLNGKWLAPDLLLRPFEFHLGIGQIYDGQGNITGFVQNYFQVTLKNRSFAINKGKETAIVIVMNLESWFETPEVWDFNEWGGDIMQNQAAMEVAAENGRDCFSLDLPILPGR